MTSKSGKNDFAEFKLNYVAMTRSSVYNFKELINTDIPKIFKTLYECECSIKKYLWNRAKHPEM